MHTAQLYCISLKKKETTETHKADDVIITFLWQKQQHFSSAPQTTFNYRTETDFFSHIPPVSFLSINKHRIYGEKICVKQSKNCTKYFIATQRGKRAQNFMEQKNIQFCKETLTHRLVYWKYEERAKSYNFILFLSVLYNNHNKRMAVVFRFQVEFLSHLQHCKHCGGCGSALKLILWLLRIAIAMNTQHSNLHLLTQKSTTIIIKCVFYSISADPTFSARIHSLSFIASNYAAFVPSRMPYSEPERKHHAVRINTAYNLYIEGVKHNT